MLYSFALTDESNRLSTPALTVRSQPVFVTECDQRPRYGRSGSAVPLDDLELPAPRDEPSCYVLGRRACPVTKVHRTSLTGYVPVGATGRRDENPGDVEGAA